MAYTVAVDEETTDRLIVQVLKNTLHTQLSSTVFEEEDADDVIDACRILVEYYGMPGKDYEYEKPI
jgi:hypothetical protein|tara:strand:- start:270 stop:467 length:198 start_codon:yes stop_codon:yes gene_type:complete